MSAPRIHSRYADGTIVVEGQQPPRISGPDPLLLGIPHVRRRWDVVNGRLYQEREYDEKGNPVQDIDFTNPTTPSGRVLARHPGPPHRHRWVAVDPDNPAAGLRRERSEELG